MKTKKKRIKEESFGKEVQKSPKKEGAMITIETYIISSGNEDCLKGMKSMTSEIERIIFTLKKREKPVLQKGVGWTVVLHHKGRKKTRDSESGIAVVSVAQAPVENKMAKKKHKGVGLDFYVQIKEVQRNEIMTLQCKFEEDKRRLQQLRAARKFRPY
ncbi:hypothetical protein JHK84_052901 [Glycine max]|uniref:Ribosomal RNA-processing protein 7 C-terminal domain-containing protein n=2 Tax=Glycine subgen. Soja TaxID=1462606 RepID=K7MXD1_SOYBN|nr:hypothetical protein JHK86_052873 [Glycine max]KAG4915394.1 hypothetical protein JHK87_052951 [Glycine soja]KAG4927245.1 hypothetical protein JHK85_053731 [Glycine max]KAG5082863.1 hypothetical protein JHK84_052901 [Glycine max]KHN24907.1 Ribosomal RNA-processing protein 7 [Glycine soja]